MVNDRRRVVWFEGMTLDPHHFQQWDRHHHGTLNARVRAAVRFDWGLTSQVIDRERLANGELVLTRCSGVLPDGFVFDIPDSDVAPAPRNVADYFPPTEQYLDVFLSLPAEHKGGGNVLLQEADQRRESRFQAETIHVSDDNSGMDERAIEIGRSRFQVRYGREPLQEFTTLQIARITRNVTGAFVLDDQFIPTCLTLDASDRLRALARKLLELLVTRSADLQQRQTTILRQRELSPADVASLGLLHTLNGHIPQLNHHLSFAHSHPEALFLTLSALAGQLTAYVPDAAVPPRDFPGYDHAHLTESFNALDRILLAMLGGAKPQANYIELPLQRVRENLYQATAGSSLLNDAQFFLIARSSDISEDQLVSKLPVMLRVASPQTIDAVLRSYTRALALEHTHRLPVGMPVDQQANYFQVQKRGPFWEAIRESEAFSVFIPEEFKAVDLKLVAVQAP